MKYDIIIIGAGPGGLTAAIYAKRANLSCAIIEKGAPGGQIINSYNVENYPGIGQISGVDLAMQMYNQVVSLEVPFIFEEVKEIKNRFVVVTNEGEYEASSVIIATGQSPKRLYLENEEKMLGRRISFCAICDGSFYKNKDVIVVGGGNSAIEESIYLSSICKNVYVLVRNQLRADELIVKELKEKENVKIMLHTKPLEYLFDDDFRGIKTNNGEILASGCFLYVGNVPNTSFVSDEIKDEYGYIITDSYMETKIKGLYAIGDCRKKELRQIVTATSDGAIAASMIKKTLGE